MRYGTKFKLYVFVTLLENQKVIHSFTNRVQPSSHKQSGDISGVTFLAVLMDELEFGITHMDMKTQERNHYGGSER